MLILPLVAPQLLALAAHPAARRVLQQLCHSSYPPARAHAPHWGDESLGQTPPRCPAAGVGHGLGAVCTTLQGACLDSLPRGRSSALDIMRMSERRGVRVGDHVVPWHDDDKRAAPSRASGYWLAAPFPPRTPRPM